MPLNGNVYTLDEAAEHLRLTNRGVAKIAKRHGLCMVRGRDILFTDADIDGIKEVMRVVPTGPVGRSHVAPVLFGDKLRKSLVQFTKKTYNKP